MATIGLIAALAAASVPLPLVAKDPSGELSQDEKSEVGKLLLEAKRAYSSKDYDVALERLRAAYAIFPDANVQRRIGETLERLRRDRDALETYQVLLTRDDVDPSMRDAVERRVSFLTELLESRRATVRVTANLDDTRIFVDGEPRGTAPLELELDPGDYLFRAESAEREPRTLRVSLGERQVFDWGVEWQTEDEPDGPSNGITKTPLVHPTPETGANPAGWIFLGIGATALAASITTYILALSEATTLDGYDGARDQVRPEDYSKIESRHNNFVIASWIGAAIGTLTTGIGAYLVLATGESGELSVAPRVDGADVRVRLRW